MNHLLFLMLALAAAAAAAAPAAPVFQDTRAQRVLACSACHGRRGRAGGDGCSPRTGGQPAGFRYHQLLNVRDGRRPPSGRDLLTDELVLGTITRKRQSMELRPVDLPATVTGSLLLGGMPGRFEPWPAFELRARAASLGLVVCLTPRSELEDLSPSYHAAVTRGALPFRWLHMPMRNFGLPDDPAAFRAGVHQVAQALRAGDAVMLHCAAGLGRTGTAAACVLKALGIGVEEALQRVRDAGSNPQNARQSGLVTWF